MSNSSVGRREREIESKGFNSTAEEESGQEREMIRQSRCREGLSFAQSNEKGCVPLQSIQESEQKHALFEEDPHAPALLY